MYLEVTGVSAGIHYFGIYIGKAILTEKIAGKHFMRFFSSSSEGYNIYQNSLGNTKFSQM